MLSFLFLLFLNTKRTITSSQMQSKTDLKDYTGECGPNAKYAFDIDAKILSIYGSGPMYDYTSDNEVPWHSYSTDILYLFITDEITSIGSYAFGVADQLKHLTLPYGIISIGNYAFYQCLSLETVHMFPSVKTIGDSAFSSNYKLTSIELPNTLETIGMSAFDDCRLLTSITIPASVKSIGVGAFAKTNSLQTLVVDPNSKYYKSLNNVVFTMNGSTLVHYASASSLTSYTIDSKVTTIYDYAFYACSKLTSITFPQSIKIIPNDCLTESPNLKTITFLSDLTEIESHSFASCSSLTTVTYYGSVEPKYAAGSIFLNSPNLKSVIVFESYRNDYFCGKPVNRIYSPTPTPMPSSSSSDSDSKSKAGLIVGIIFGILGAAGIAVGAFYFYKKRTNSLEDDKLLFQSGDDSKRKDYYIHDT